MMKFCKIFILIALMLAPLCASAEEDRIIPSIAQIVILKAERKMYLVDAESHIIKSYRVALGTNPTGDKQAEGDGRTPEGRYEIDFRNENSEFHRSLRISYPNKADLWRAKKLGFKPGSNIFIHGEPPERSWMFWHYSPRRDWTHGCIAVTNDDIDEIWALVPEGTPVLIRP